MDDTFRPSRDPTLFGVVFRVKQAADVEAVDKAVRDEIGRIAAGKVDAARLDAVRSNLKYATILGLETAQRVAVRLATTAALTGDLDYMNKLYARIDRLPPAALAVFARRWLRDGNCTTLTLSTTGAASEGGR
jgi:zinc protease